ncbi:MAG: hypothetical protein LLG04_14870 [Parachlamydia sp.]|nr:hypothetical protein [Parachlamydia sp.]
MNTLLASFRMTPTHLINHSGQQFARIPYASELHSDLAFKLQDPDLARAIHSAYMKHVDPKLLDSEKEMFSKALVRVCYLFGSLQYPPHLALRLALIEEKFPQESWDRLMKEEALKQFMEEANPQKFPLRPKNQLPHVVITTTTAAGGNLSVAKGLKQELKKRFRVTVLDVEAVSKEVDPLVKASGTHTFDGLYSEFVQQENKQDEAFKIRYGVYRDVARYIEPIMGQVLKEKIHALGADFVLSTLNSDPLSVSIPIGLGIPGCVLHCDAEVGYHQHEFVGKIGGLVKLWFSDTHPSPARVFKPLLDRTGIKWMEHQEKTWEAFREVLGQAVHVPAKDLETQLEFVGFPTRPEIRRIKDSKEIERIRTKWRLELGEVCIPISMGQNGVGAMREIFAELLRAPAPGSKIKYIFVCGTNAAMKKEFDQQLASTDRSKSALKSCLTTGFISGDEMNELLNIGTLLVGKPGGSQIEECIKTRIPMMVMFRHDYWESGNHARLEKAGYALSYDPKESLASQIERHAAHLQNHKPPKVPTHKWKQLVPQAINSALGY